MPSASTIVTRRLVVPDAFRWAKVVFGLLMIAGPAYVGWAASWNELSCKNEACNLRQELVLQSTGNHRFDARTARRRGRPARPLTLRRLQQLSRRYGSVREKQEGGKTGKE